MRTTSPNLYSCRNFFAMTGKFMLFLAVLVAGSSRAALAQATAPTLGTAESFAVLGGSTVTNTGPSVVTGDLGVSPGTAITGFPPGTVVGGTTHAADAVAGQAESDTAIAYGNLAGQPCGKDLSGTDLGGLTLTPGVYCFSAAAQLTGTLTLDAKGNSDAAWVFQIGTSLTTASNSAVVLIDGAQQCKVFWQVGSSATLGTGTNLSGSVLALASITLTTDAKLTGRALAQTGAVTLDSNPVSIAACAVPPPIPPTLSKSFSPASIKAGGDSTLTITLSNTDDAAAILSAPLTDTLPAGVTVAGAGSTTCTSGSVSAKLGGSAVTLLGGSIAAGSSCTVTVLVTAAAGGNYINSLTAGALKTSNGGNASPAVATLSVTAPVSILPTLGKAFSPDVITAGGVSTLTITLSNANPAAATLTAPLVDDLPSGVTVFGASTNTCGGTVTAVVGSSSVTLTGGAIPADGSCTVTAIVTAPLAGSYFNSLAAGALKTSSGNNAAPAVATLTVNAPALVPPTLAKAFNPSTINAGGISTLTITLSNANSTADTLTAPLVDNLPSGVTVSGASTTTCGGTVTAVLGSSSVTLTGGAIPADGSCTVTAIVTAPLAGSYLNSLAAGALKTSSGSNASPTSATLTVNAPVLVPPTIAKAFNPSTINAGAISTLTIALSNANATVDKLTAPLVDNLPPNMTVDGTATTTCGGAVTAVKGSSKITLTGGSIPAHGSCTITVPVTAQRVKCDCVNVIPAGALITSGGSNLAPAIASLTVNAAVVTTPILSKAFAPTTIKPGGEALLTIKLRNPTATVDTITAPFTDTFPSGLFADGPAANTCGGVSTAHAGGSSVTLTGGSIPANGSCTVSVEVTAKSSGTYLNELTVCSLHTSKGCNPNSYTATFTVGIRLVKSFSPTAMSAGSNSLLTITLDNPATTAAKLTAPLTDTLPAGLTVSGPATSTCGGVVTAPIGGSTVTLTGGTIPAAGSCTVTVDVTATAPACYYNTLPVGALKTTNGSNTALFTASVTVN